MDFSRVKKWRIPVNGEMKEVKQVTHNGTVLWKGTHMVTWRFQASYGVWTTVSEEYDDGATPSRADAYTVTDGNSRYVFDEWDNLSPVTEDRVINAVYHQEYNVTSLSGTNCNAYTSQTWTTPFATGWHRTTDKIFWRASDAYCYSWTETGFIDYSVADVLPGVNSSAAAFVKRWVYNITLSCPYQASPSTSRGNMKVWRTSSPYQHATDGASESDPLLYTTNGDDSAYVYYGDVLNGKAQITSVGYNFAGYTLISDRDDVLETFTSKEILSVNDINWSLTIYPNIYELALMETYGEWDTITSSGVNLYYYHLDGTESEYPIVAVHTGTQIVYGRDHEGTVDITKIQITDYTPTNYGVPYDITFVSPQDTATYEYTFIEYIGPATITGNASVVASVARKGLQEASLSLSGIYGLWTCDGAEVSAMNVHVGDAVIISNNTVTVGPNPVGPYSADVYVFTWTTQSSDHDYTYTFEGITLDNPEQSSEISENGNTLEAHVTRTPNPFTVTWRWQSAYGVWTTTTETYRYGETPSRAEASTVTDGNTRNYSLGWDDLSPVVEDRTINATYKTQYNVTGLSGTHCTSSSSLGWYDTTDTIHWTADTAYAFDANNTTTFTSLVVAGVNTATASYVKNWVYRIKLNGSQGNMKVWRTSSPYQHATAGGSESDPLMYASGGEDYATIYYGDVLSGKFVANTGYHFGTENSDNLETFSNRTITSAPETFYTWERTLTPNVYELALQCNYGSWDWEHYRHIDGSVSDYPIVIIHYNSTISCSSERMTITDAYNQYSAQTTYYIDFDTPEPSGSYEYSFINITAPSTITGDSTATASVARHGLNIWAIELEGSTWGHWEDPEGTWVPMGPIDAYEGDEIVVSGNEVTIGPNPVGPYSEYVQTYVWITDSSTSSYTISFDHIEFDSTAPQPWIEAYDIATPNPGKAYITAGTGVSAVYLSTNSSATSGSASGALTYNGGERVYGFAVVQVGYVIPSDWVQVAAATSSSGAKYRVDYWDIAGDVDFGTINLSRSSGTLSQGTLPTGVSSLICYRKPWNGSSYSEFAGGTIYYGDSLYWTATASTGYYNPSLTYYDSSHVYIFTGANGTSITSVASSGLVAGARRTWTLSITKGNYLSTVYYKKNSGSNVEVTSTTTLNLDYADSVVVSGTAQSEAPYNYGSVTGVGTFTYSSSNETQSTTVSCTRSVKTYTLTISVTNSNYGTYSVSRTSSPYQGASTGALTNGATIYYGDVLTGTSSGNGISYGAWNITSVSSPSVTSTGDATTGNITVQNTDSNVVTLYYNTVNAVGGTSLGSTASGATKTQSGLSFSTTYYCSASRSRSRDKYDDTKSNTNYTGTNGVTGNVTASFTFSRTTSTDTGTVYSLVVPHTTHARNSYVLTVNKGYYKITGVNSKSTTSTGETPYTHTYLYGESYSYTYSKTGYTSQTASGTITGTTTQTLILSPTAYALSKNLTNWSGNWYATEAYGSTITYRYYGYPAYFRATPNAGYYADISATHYYTGVYYYDSVATDSTSDATITLSATALGKYKLTINVTNGSYGSYSVTRTYTESGQGTGALSNNADIYENDILVGASSGNGTSYSSWSISSVTAPAVTSTGDATSGNITVTNKDSGSATLYYNTTNTTGGTSLGVASYNESKTQSGLSFGTTYYCSAARTRTRNKYDDTASSSNYSGTSDVSGNVTANFTFSRSTTEESSVIYSSVVSHTTALQNKYTVTWKNWDGTTLETDTNVAYGSTPVYNGATPTRPTDVQYVYTFSYWSGPIIVTGNITKTAQFSTEPRLYNITITAPYLSDYANQGISPWFCESVGEDWPNSTWTAKAGYGASVESVDNENLHFTIEDMLFYENGDYSQTIDGNFVANTLQNDNNFSYTYNSITGITEGGYITGDTTISLSITRVGRDVTVDLSGSYGYWQGYNNSSVSIIAHYGDNISISGNTLTIGSTTYTWVTTSSDTSYTYSFNRISNNTGDTTVVDGCSFTAYVDRTPNSGAVSITAGTGVSSVFLSTSSTATSGSPSGTTFDGGSTVYAYIVASAGYYSTSPCTGGTQYDTGAIYRVGSVTVAGNQSFGTKSASPNPTIKWTGSNQSATLDGSAMTSGTAYSVKYNSSHTVVITASSGYYISTTPSSFTNTTTITVNNSTVPTKITRTLTATSGYNLSSTATAYYTLSTSFASLPYSGSITYSNGQTETVALTNSSITKNYSGTLNYSLTVMSVEVKKTTAGDVTTYGKLQNGEYPYGYNSDDKVITSYSKSPSTVTATTTNLTGNWLGSGTAYHKIVFSFNGTGSSNHSLSATSTDSAAANITKAGVSQTLYIGNSSTSASITMSSGSNRFIVMPYSSRTAGTLSTTSGYTVSPTTFSAADQNVQSVTATIAAANVPTKAKFTITNYSTDWDPDSEETYFFFRVNSTFSAAVSCIAELYEDGEHFTTTGRGTINSNSYCDYSDSSADYGNTSYIILVITYNSVEYRFTYYRGTDY